MAKYRMGELVVLIGAVLIVLFAVMVGWIVYVKPPPVEYVYLETDARIHGEAVYRSQGCSACHEIFNNGTSTFGPGLDGVGSRRQITWLSRYLKNPWPDVSARKYKLKMPAVKGISEQDYNALVDYLSALRKLTIKGSVIEP